MPLGSAVTPVRTAAMAPIHRSRARRVPPLHVTPVDRASAVALATALLLTSAPPAAHVHAHLLADVGEGAPASGFVERIKAALPKPLQEDPFGGDRVDKTRAPLASTKEPMPIITEQEAVVTEAFPNPSAAMTGVKPPVLAGAEGDESGGSSAGKYEGVTENDRQALIDAKSPAAGYASDGPSPAQAE